MTHAPAPPAGAPLGPSPRRCGGLPGGGRRAVLPPCAPQPERGWTCRRSLAAVGPPDPHPGGLALEGRPLHAAAGGGLEGAVKPTQGAHTARSLLRL